MNLTEHGARKLVLSLDHIPRISHGSAVNDSSKHQNKVHRVKFSGILTKPSEPHVSHARISDTLTSNHNQTELQSEE